MAEIEHRTLFSQYEQDTLIEVRELASRRQLVFNHTIIQTEIACQQPETLALPLHQYCLAGQLFSEQPKHVLLAGLGGGALARYFAYRFSDTKGDAVEISPLVCQLAKDFFDFPKINHWRIHQESIQDYIAHGNQVYDYINVDLAEGLNTPDWLIDHQFLSQLKNKLTPQGHIAFNLLSEDIGHMTNCIQAIRQTFKDTTACLAVPHSNNVVMYAYRDKPIHSTVAVAKRLTALSKQWGLPFGQFFEEMQNSNPKGSGIF